MGASKPAARAGAGLERMGWDRLRMGFSTWEADHGLAIGTLKQCSAELRVLLSAMQHGCADHITHAVLMGIADKLAVAAELAELEESEASDG